ncbi:unnamed protein product [Bursaphelenchus okinawaensis]|uniref:DUF659 domain-containing protein n=1 Tax=Bursaphelenchus okinawaensis TaxID=465554 RepID=A0A811LD82_9BILA|nr:unnamed protein product [Bursaphelenchus okinawaensis]CAG9121768.1 unnamed protein product [Bursaphelenchus okinawaensis]
MYRTKNLHGNLKFTLIFLSIILRLTTITRAIPDLAYYIKPTALITYYTCRIMSISNLLIKHPDVWKEIEADGAPAKKERNILDNWVQLPQIQKSSSQPTIKSVFQSLAEWSKEDPRYKKCEKAVAQYLIGTAQPLSTVDNELFIEMLNTLNPNFTIRKQKHFSNVVIPKMVSDTTTYIINELKDSTNITIAIDEWTDKSIKYSLFGLVIYYMTKEFKLQYFVIRCSPIKAKKAVDICDSITDVLQMFKIDDTKIKLILRDGASAVKKACDTMGKPSFHCFAHRLNLACQNAIEKAELKPCFEKIRRAVKKNKEILHPPRIV